MHEPRVGSALAMSFMVSPTGADHCHAEPDGLMAIPPLFKSYNPIGYLKPVGPVELTPTKVAIFRIAELKSVLYDSLVVCHFPGPDFDQTVELVKCLTGWNTGIPELLRIGERILTLLRMFNLREGLTIEDDNLPPRLLGPTTDGALANYKVDTATYDRLKKYYYSLMGWDSNGVPLPEKVEDLAI
jgi:aldehyde:ferredoxin oxidoreductase